MESPPGACSFLVKAMDEAALKKELLRKESPFSWNIPRIVDRTYEKYISSQSEKLQNMEEENDFQWTRFIISLLLSYELSDKMKDHSRALTHIKWCKDHLLQLNRNKCKETLFNHIFSTLLYICCVTEAVILLELGQLHKAHEVAGECTMMKISGLLGTKAAVYIQYGTVGHRLALETASEASKLDPDQAEWWFIIGNALGRLRRTEISDITKEEIIAIEKAFALEKNASYTVHLAQLYSDYSNNYYFNQNLVKSKMYAKAAVSRYRDAISMRPNCMLLKARVAHGMLRIRDREAQDIPLAKKLLYEVAQSTPSNPMVYHDLGYYYERFEKNTKEAIICLSKSSELGNIKAFVFLINIKWKYGKDNEIIGDLEKSLTKYKTEECQALLLACLGASHILINGDWVLAVESFLKSLQVDPCAKYMEKFQGFDNRYVNLLELVTNHLHTKAAEPTGESRVKFVSFLDLVGKMRPNIIHHDIRKYTFSEWKNDMLKVNKKNQNKKATAHSMRRVFQIK